MRASEAQTAEDTQILVLPVSNGVISDDVLNLSEPVCSALKLVFIGLRGAHDVKHRAWCIVGVPQASVAFIVNTIVFSKPRTVGAHCLVFLQTSA